MNAQTEQPTTFDTIKLTNINVRIEEMLAGLDDDQRAAIRQIQDDMADADRVYAMTLGMIRNAASRTQVDVARSLHITQGAVARTEARSDMLLSTLQSYLAAVGADMSIRVRLANGVVCELAIADLVPITSSND